MDSTNIVASVSNTNNMDNTNNVASVSNTNNMDSTNIVASVSNTNNMDNTNNVASVSNTNNMESTNIVASVSNTNNMDNTNNVASVSNTNNMDNTSNVVSVSNMNNMDNTNNVFSVSNTNNMDNTSNVVSVSNTNNMDNTNNVVSVSNTNNMDNTNNVASVSNTNNMDNTNNVASVSNTNNMDNTNIVASVSTTNNIDNTNNVASISKTNNMDNTNNVVSVSNTNNMDNTSNVASVSNMNNMDSTNNVDSVSNTNHMEDTNNVVSVNNTSNMDNTSNVPVGTSNTEYENAISHFKKNLDIAKDTGDKFCEMNACLELSRAYLEIEQYGEAASHAKECIRITQEISVKKATEKDGSSLDVAGIYVKNESLGPGAAEAYFIVGLSEAHLALYEDSLDSFKKCAAIATEIGEEMVKIMSCCWIARLYEEKGQWDDVIEISKRYIDKMCLFVDKEIEIESYLRLASALSYTNKCEEAVIYGKKCMETIGDSQDASESTECVYALYILGQSYLKLNKHDEAINCGKKFLEISTKTGNKKDEMEARQILAFAYNGLDQFDSVFYHANKGMAIAEEQKNNTAKQSFISLLSIFFSLVGMEKKFYAINPDMKAFEEVPTSPRQELDALVKAVRAGDVDQQIRCQLRLHNYYESKHQYERAINCLERVIALQPDCSEGKLFCYTSIAILYIKMEKCEKGQKHCEVGLREIAGCKNKKILFNFLFFISQLYYANGNLQLAEKYLNEAVQCFETLYGSVGSNEDFKMSIIDKSNACFRLLSLVYLQTNRKEESLLVLDKCRARVLKDILVINYGMQENKEASDMKFSDIEALVSNNQFAIVYHSVFTYPVTFFFGYNYFEALVHQLNFDEKRYNRIIDKMFDEIEVLEEVNCEDRTLDTQKDVKQQTEEEPDTDELERFEISTGLRKRSFVMHKKRILMKDVEKNRLATALEFLYLLIINEYQSLIKQSEIIFIPDGSLCKIPFAALQDPDTGKYLSESKRIRLAPSIATLKLLGENIADYNSSGGALIIGDPDVGKVMFDGKEEGISRLERANTEAKLVAYHLDVEPLLGEKATKPAVLERLREGVSVVHIAAHGILSKATIVLAPSPEIRATKIPDEEDYMLTMADVQQAKVRAQLVVLSCCHSGRGEIRAEGVVGMCRAFLASGARAVVASLWAIDDEATLEFMAVFYGHLKMGKSASTSLQLTMNEMRKTSSKPKYWASFFLMGDDVTLKIT